MENEGIRINKFLSEAGVCSRREADRRIENQEITINGRIAMMGDRVMEADEVCVSGRAVTKEEEMILLVLNKPTGIVCTAEKMEKNNVIDFLHYPKRIYPIGRLDKDSQGLLLLTNNGEIVNKIMRSGNMHEKEYIVTVNKPVSDSFVRGLAGGVPLVELGTTTRPCKVKKIGDRKIQIILTQGLNRQIRRMCEYFGYRVEKLERVRIMNIRLGDLPVGQYREVTAEEYEELLRMTRDSSSESVREGDRLGTRSHSQKQRKQSEPKNPKKSGTQTHQVYRTAQSTQVWQSKRSKREAMQNNSDKK